MALSLVEDILSLVEGRGDYGKYEQFTVSGWAVSCLVLMVSALFCYTDM